MKAETGLWIDHREAVIVVLSKTGEEIKRIASTAEKQLRRSADPSNGSFEAQDVPADDSREREYTGHLAHYYDEVISYLRAAGSILIFGPGEAKGELKKRVEKDKSNARIVAVETVDKMTDPQIVAKVRAYLHFFWAGLVKHGQTGGIMPSQRFLIAKMIVPVPETYRGQVIELGAGNGALTLRLAARCPEARILACEINPTLARDHRRNLAEAGLSGRVELFAGSAADLLSDLVNGRAEKPDFIISGIPLGNLGREKALALIDTIRQSLREGGMYIQFQHSLLDRKKIKTRFPNVRTIPAFLNFPPAVVYYAQK